MNHGAALILLVLLGCSVSASAGKTPNGNKPRSAEGAVCSVVEGGQRYCFDTSEQRQRFDEGMAEEAERKRLFLAEKAEEETRQVARRQAAIDEQDRLAGVAAEKRRAADERQAHLNDLAADKGYAQRAVSALMCDLRAGPNAEWIDWWRQILAERYRAKPLSCDAVRDVLECYRDATTCTEATRDVADVWRFSQRALKGDGLREDAPLRCCDGTESPSCTCGGSRGGCCSHHGGVCGCSR